MVLDKKRTVLLACDFETTVFEGQTSTEVWSAAYARLYSDKVLVLHSIEEFIKDLIDYRVNIIAWFHNERFDGTFIVNYLLQQGWTWTTAKKGEAKQFKTLISAQNRWYSITLFTGKSIIEIRDSAKLMPMTLADMGVAFNTEHRKKEMEYKGHRYAGCNITPEEMEYIINDVLVLKEALEYMIDEGNVGLTIGSCALEKYKTIVGKYEYETNFPKLYKHKLDPELFYNTNADEYIRKTYKGAFCYLKKGREGRQHKGRTYDVNSLYPSVMHSKSGNVYPIGKPHFWVGEIPEAAKRANRVYFVCFSCRFTLKEGYLPTVQIKGNRWYNPREWLETSDIKRNGKYYYEVYDRDGNRVIARPTLYMTYIDWMMFNEHYNIYDLEMHSGCWFYGKKGLFDDYIDYWMDRKENATSKAMRTEAKFFSNNLYGKFATSRDSSYREPILKCDGSIELILHDENEKEPGYIAVGSMVTSYARIFTITAAQKNYDAFIYADTDSIHIDDVDPIGVPEHPSKMLHWKLESEWSSAIFIRQKTYAEFVRKENHKKVEPHWDIKCAGMPDKSKKLFLATHPITDFKPGLSVGGKLTPVRIPGGVVLKDQKFTLHRR